MSVSTRFHPRWLFRLTRAAVAVVGLAVAACSRDAPTAPALSASSAVSAAADSGPRFTFLAPLGTGTADSASFDAAAAPVVEVCAWTGAACAGAPVVRFSTAPVGAEQPITVNGALGQYEANWSLLSPTFTTRRTYRIAVFESGAVAGSVLVDVVRGRYALTRTDGTLGPLTAASTLPIRFALRRASTPPPPPPPLSCNSGVLVNGLTCAGSIAAAGQEDRWTFTADSGAYFAVAAGADSGTNLVPFVRVVSPAGVLVATDYRANATAEAAARAPVAGTYTVIVSDGSNGGRRGGYRVTLALGPGAAPQVSAGDQGGALANGATYVADIYTGDVDTWTFTADAGAYFAVAAGADSGTNLVPFVRVVSPAGVLVATDYRANATAEAAARAPVAGTYTVIVSDGSNGGRRGGYRVTLALGPGAAPQVSAGDQGGALANGATYVADIYTGDVDTWTFTADAGAYFAVAAGADSGTNLVPFVRVVSPAGVLVATDYRANATAEAAARAPVAGTYTVIVSDGSNGGRRGGYRVTLALGPGAAPQVSAGDQGGALANGATYVADIYTGDVDTWTFTADAGAYFAVAAGADSGTNLVPFVRVVSPAGVLVATDYRANATAEAAARAPVAGTYTVIVSDGSNGGRRGGYRVTLALGPGAAPQVSAGDQGGALANGATYVADIYTGDVDTWTFTADAGAYFAVAAGADSGTNLVPFVRVVSPAGVLVATDYRANATAEAAARAPVAGTYTVIVSDGSNGGRRGGYRVTLALGPGAAPQVSAGDQGGALANGATYVADIYTGDVDTWTFTADAGAYFAVAAGADSGTNLVPFVRVVSPAGVLVATDYRANATAEAAARAPVAGTYTVIVSDGSNGGRRGGYRVTLALGPGAAPQVSAGDQGGALANGATYVADIYTGDVDTWTFTAISGASVSVQMARTGSSTLLPSIRVVSPAGVVIATGYSGGALAQTTFTPVPGSTYTVITSDGSGQGRTGDYTLSASTVVAAAQATVKSASSQ